MVLVIYIPSVLCRKYKPHPPSCMEHESAMHAGNKQPVWDSSMCIVLHPWLVKTAFVKPFWLLVANVFLVPFQTQPFWLPVANGFFLTFSHKAICVLCAMQG